MHEVDHLVVPVARFVELVGQLVSDFPAFYDARMD